MAETSDMNGSTGSTTSAVPKKHSATPRTPPHKIYALPAPFRTFPLPSFYPSNPLSLAHLVYAWLKQTVLSPPANEPSTQQPGEWSPETRSVIVVDAATMRILWEQGFFGKGSLSRSEPNWLKREKIRRGLNQGNVAEQVTNQRREERLRTKWERARLEQEAIERTRLEETQAALRAREETETPISQHVEETLLPARSMALSSAPPVGPQQLVMLPNSDKELKLMESQGCIAMGSTDEHHTNGTVHPLADKQPVNGNHESNGVLSTSELADAATKTLRRQKSVHFSPRVSSTTYEQNAPLSPAHLDTATPATSAEPAKSEEVVAEVSKPSTDDIEDQEYLQLSPQEAFYLVFAIGALSVVDPKTQSELSPLELLHLFADFSFFPPRISTPISPGLRTDDHFLVHYVVFHHFRSLGWIPREGVKFGVDWLLYRRGPVFDHAEFGLVVVPSYSHPEWRNEERGPQRELTWHWLHGIQRVLSHVLKSFVLIYVDIPPPSALKAVSDPEKGISGLLEQYRVREVMVRRWSSNRNR